MITFPKDIKIKKYKLFLVFYIKVVMSLNVVQAESISIKPDDIVLYKSINEKTLILLNNEFPFLNFVLNNYEDNTKLFVGIFKPKNYSKNKTVIFFYGGAWRSGRMEQFFPQCKALSEIGYGCVTAEYRTSKKHGTSPLHSLEDSRDAVKFIMSRGNEFNLNTQNIWVGGGSAGGHLAAAIAMSNIAEFAFEPLPVKGLLLLNPVVDNSETGYGHERVKYISKNFSPLHADYVPKIPVLFQVGSLDPFISIKSSKSFVERFKKVGANAVLKVYEDEKHGFFNHDKMFEKTLTEMINFLSLN